MSTWSPKGHCAYPWGRSSFFGQKRVGGDLLFSKLHVPHYFESP